MPFTVPNFNLLADRWDSPALPSADPPTETDEQCQLYIPSRGLVDITPGSPDDWVPPIYLRLPALANEGLKGSIWEVIPGSADYYKARWVQKIHLGFPNEYWVVLVEQCDADGTTPRA